jgi:release factor glutamine methyltransferase
MNSRCLSAGQGAETLAGALAEATARLQDSSETARLDAEVLLLHILGRDRAYLRAWPEHRLGPELVKRYRNLIESRAEGVPVAYLTGRREFWSRDFAVGPGVLIPRPETELLVELALAAIPWDAPADILELGTGSGAIAVTLSVERPRAEITATDLSAEALAVAEANAARYGRDRIRFHQGSWYTALPASAMFDLIVSNPPYIAERDPHLLQGDLRYEPRLALATGPDGLEALCTIAEGARTHLRPGGQLMLEHGHKQAAALAAVLAALGYAGLVHHRDLQGHCRVVTATWPGSFHFSP